MNACLVVSFCLGAAGLLDGPPVKEARNGGASTRWGRSGGVSIEFPQRKLAEEEKTPQGELKAILAATATLKTERSIRYRGAVLSPGSYPVTVVADEERPGGRNLYFLIGAVSSPLVPPEGRRSSPLGPPEGRRLEETKGAEDSKSSPLGPPEGTKGPEEKKREKRREKKDTEKKDTEKKGRDGEEEGRGGQESPRARENVRQQAGASPGNGGGNGSPEEKPAAASGNTSGERRGKISPARIRALFHLVPAQRAAEGVEFLVRPTARSDRFSITVRAGGSQGKATLRFLEPEEGG